MAAAMHLDTPSPLLLVLTSSLLTARAALKSFVVPIIVICGVRAVGRVSLWRSYITRLSRLYGCLSLPIHVRCVCIVVIRVVLGNVGNVGNVSNVGNVGNVGIMCIMVIGGIEGAGARGAPL